MENRNKNKLKLQRNLTILIIVFAVFIVVGGIFLIKRYAPTTERMDLSEYFKQTTEDEVSIILNGTYLEENVSNAVNAIYTSDGVYINLNCLKQELDDGYVYDSTDQVLRYVTDTDVISVNFGATDYSINKTGADLGIPIVISAYDEIYVAMDFVKYYTDLTYTHVTSPDRIMIETAGWEHTVATVKRNTEARRFGGNKSKILADVAKGSKVIILDNYGKWSLVLTEDGVLGCVKNRKLKDKTDVTTEKTLADRTYNHISYDDTITMAWHQVTNTTANGTLEDTLAATSGINVISPTWFHLSDNSGGISNISSASYVSFCHSKGIKVWGLVSNLENKNVDTEIVLNTTSSRDQLVNNLIAAAISCGMDGINVDIEELPSGAADGYIEFIRELSLKCEKNDLVLSVDNYAPSVSSMIYDRAEQSKFADYIVIMAYDEHYAGDDEPGSVASLPFVSDAITNTLAEVPAEQTILGCPFYCRAWTQRADGTLTSKALGMDNAKDYASEKGISLAWDDELGQYYGETTTEEGNTIMLWLEDSKSLDQKLSLMKSNNLAGAAFWKLGFENASTWTTISKYK